MNIFKTRQQRVLRYRQPVEVTKIDVPDNLYSKCDACESVLHTEEVVNNQFVCPRCGHHFRMRARDRVQMFTDADSFREFNRYIRTENPLDFPNYLEKVDALTESTGLAEAVITGYAKLRGRDCVIAVMDSYFLMGSMGSVVGEKITRAIERATKDRLPLIIFSASGGARMQEGLFSLMQMAKTSAALARHSEAGLLYVSILTDPTTGGVTASFASLGDIIVAEPNALIGFAGPRVIEQTIMQKLPEGFQRAEFLLEKGFVDYIAERKNLRDVVARLIKYHVKE